MYPYQHPDDDQAPADAPPPSPPVHWVAEAILAVLVAVCLTTFLIVVMSKS